tara:strand:- start:588 stop:830 length:243 start_codon:yes stop_codon:yes gene_type:complete
MASKFTINADASEDEVWEKILETLDPEERKEADRLISEINEPYEGGKEIIVKSNNNSNIAFASISEIRLDETDWSVYKES